MNWLKTSFFYLGMATLTAATFVFVTGWLSGPSSVSEAVPAYNGPLKASPITRCMNMGGALEAPSEGEWGYTIRDSDFGRLRRAGFDTVRVPIKFSAYTKSQPPYEISPSIFARTDQVVDAALAAGLNVIIDVHHYEELMSAPHHHERRLEAMWNQIAYHYATAPDSLMFELINEPNDKMTVLRTDELNRRLLSIVRAHNPTRWVIVGSAGWGSLEALMQSRPPRDPYLITTFHYYDPFEFTHQGATWLPEEMPLGQKWGSEEDYDVVIRDMQTAAQWRDSSGLPMLLGEFGVINKTGQSDRAQWTKAVREAAEANGIGWCYWEWGTGFAAYDLDRDRWIPQMRRALTGR